MKIPCFQTSKYVIDTLLTWFVALSSVALTCFMIYLLFTLD